MFKTLVGVVVGAVIGFILSWLPGWFDRRRKLKTHWHATRAELERCHEKATTLLNDGVRAPLDRLPLVAFNTSFPILLSEGELTEGESLIIGRCFDQIQDINRGLDYASEMHKLNEPAKLEQEYNRNLLKAKTLLGKDGKASLYDPAKAIVDAKINRRRWRY